MKKNNLFRTILTGITLLFGIAASTIAQEYDFKQGQLYYKITDTEAKKVEVVNELGMSSNYTEGNQPTGKVVIPATVTNKSIVYSVTGIGRYALGYTCKGITEIQIGANVELIHLYAIDSRLPKLSAFTVADGNKHFMAINGILFSIDGKQLIRYPMAKTESSYIIPDGVEELGFGVFHDDETITTISLPKSLQILAGYAFSNCPNLTTFIGLENTQLTNINNYCFDGIGISSFSVPNGVVRLSDYFLSRCENMKEVDISSSVTEIGWNSFSYNPLLTTIRCHAATPPIIMDKENVFIDTDITSITLYVPVGSKALYDKAPTWKDFGKIIENPVVSIPPVQSDKIKVWTNDGTLYMNLSQSDDVYIYNMSGVFITKLLNVSGETSVSLPPGVYVVKTGGFSTKILNH